MEPLSSLEKILKSDGLTFEPIISENKGYYTLKMFGSRADNHILSTLSDKTDDSMCILKLDGYKLSSLLKPKGVDPIINYFNYGKREKGKTFRVYNNEPVLKNVKVVIDEISIYVSRKNSDELDLAMNIQKEYNSIPIYIFTDQKDMIDNNRLKAYKIQKRIPSSELLFQDDT